MASESTTDLLKRLTDLISDGITTVTINQVESMNGAARGIPPMVGVTIEGRRGRKIFGDPDVATAIGGALDSWEYRGKRKAANSIR
ncbi:MAG TPA: hypothetical protein VNV62_17560 [Trebonia sp.]|jgi:hypothetical protein|nr:hypothetical protein [Trebonia sp.]